MLTEHSKFCKGMLLSMQYFCGLIMMFKKNGSIVEKMVIIVVSNIHGMIKLTNGLLLINSYNEGMNSILSVLNDSLLSDIFHLVAISLVVKYFTLYHRQYYIIYRQFIQRFNLLKMDFILPINIITKAPFDGAFISILCFYA